VPGDEAFRPLDKGGCRWWRRIETLPCIGSTRRDHAHRHGEERQRRSNPAWRFSTELLCQSSSSPLPGGERSDRDSDPGEGHRNYERP